MKTKLSLFVFAALALMIAQGCGSKADKKDIARIDSAAAQVEKTAQLLKEVNIDTLKARNERYKANAAVLSASIHEIKNDETWPWICAYGNVRKPFKMMVLDYYKYKAELDTCRKQLGDMKHDLDNGALDKKDFGIYFLLECNALNDLDSRIRKSVTSVTGQMKNFDTVHPVICKIIKEFKEKETKNPNKSKKEQAAPEETD